MSKEKDLLRNYVKEKHLKMTNQREKILDFFVKWKAHLTSEEMFHKLTLFLLLNSSCIEL